MELQGRRVIVTGAAGGIGSAIVAACARQGARVAAVDQVETTISLEADFPAEAITSFVADLADPQACSDLVAEVNGSLGEIDGLVNCAGVMRRGDLLEVDEDDWAVTFGVNVEAVMRLCRAALPSLIAAESGAVVNIASQWGAAAGPRSYRVQQLEGRRRFADPQPRRGLRRSGCAGELDLSR